MLTQIVNGKVLTPSGWIDNGSVLIDGSRVKAVLKTSSQAPDVTTVIDAKGGYILPGAIDLHVHGGGGHDFMEGTEEAFRVSIATHRKHGTTSLFPTLAASTMPMMRKAMETGDRLAADPMSGVLGMHMEGPYFNPKMAGGQIPEMITPPVTEDYKALTEEYTSMARWDASPELPGTAEFGDYLTSKGVIVGLAHTAATAEQIEEAYNHGFTHATHFYNAMTGHHKVGVFKHPGVIEAVYLNDGITVEVISDGIHVPPLMIKLVYKQKGVDRMCLVTDANAMADSDGTKAFDPRVIIEDGVCQLADHSAIAGSIATMDRMIKVAVQKAGIPLEDVSRMVSATPAKIMGVYDRKGSIERGKDADIIIFDNDLALTHVIHMGQLC